MVDQTQISYYQQKLQYEIDAWDLHQAIQNGEHIIILDVRSAEAYNKEHISGAINFPHRTINVELAKERLKVSTQYVTYCDGIGCNASTKGALKLAQLGYQVKELIGGIDWWRRDAFPTTQISVSELNSQCGCEG